MIRHELLTGLHKSYAPRTYLEIGVNDGRGLARSHTRTIGVDPEFKVTAELACDLQLAKATSDDFFARPDPIGWFPEGVIDFAFIDGLHVFEFALRDFINTERLCGPASVIVFDDMLPRSVAEAARDRHTSEWAGDVYKVALVLARYRPDLVVVPIDTEPTGLLLVIGLDPTSTVLTDHYDEILAEWAVDDPQAVPHEVMHRTTAADPAALLAAPVWGDLAAARTTGGTPESVAALAELRGTATFVWTEPEGKLWSAKKRANVAPHRTAAKKTAANKAAKKTAAKKAAARKAAAPTSVAGTLLRVRKAIKRRL
jgi:hypothetical protein